MSKSEKSPFFKAIENSQLQVVQEMIGSGVDVNQVDHKGRNALFFTTNLRIVEVLLNAGCSANHRELSGQSIFEKRSVSPYETAIAEMLLKYGADGKISDLALKKKNFQFDFYGGVITEKIRGASSSVNPDLEIDKIKEFYGLYPHHIENVVMSQLLKKPDRAEFLARALKTHRSIDINLFASFLIHNQISDEASTIFLVVSRSHLQLSTIENFEDFEKTLASELGLQGLWSKLTQICAEFNGFAKNLKLDKLMELRRYFSDPTRFDRIVDGQADQFLKFSKKTINIGNEVFVPELRPILRIVFYEIVSDFVSATQRKWRLAKNLPMYDSAWPSETKLFYELKNAFPDLLIVQHGRPKWLGLQHFDIYFPDFNVAVEYQGEQHDRPIEFFGGQKAFEELQERDARKLRVSKENGCVLLYARPSYTLEKIIQEIQEFLKEDS